MVMSASVDTANMRRVKLKAEPLTPANFKGFGQVPTFGPDGYKRAAHLFATSKNP
jgi:hypothetical protein